MSIFYRLLLLPFILLLTVPVITHGQGLFEESLGENPANMPARSPLGGTVRSLFYGGYDKAGEGIYTQSASVEGHIRLDLATGSFGKAFADLRFRSGFEFNEQYTTFTLREGWGEVYAGPLTIRAGKQIITWGSTSFVNPSDQFSPVSPTTRSPFADDLRLGNWALRTDLTISKTSTLQFIWLPIHRSSKLLTTPIAFPSYIAFSPEKQPLKMLIESSFGLRYDLRTSVLDMQLSYYNGFRNNPAITIDTAIFDVTTLTPVQISLGQAPYRIHSAGFNMTIPACSYLFRAEAAWMEPHGVDSPAEIPLPEWSWAVEIEQSGAAATIIAGYYGKYIMDFSRAEGNLALLTDESGGPGALVPPGTVPGPDALQGILDAQIMGFNRLYNYQQEEFLHAAYASVTISMLNDQVELEFPGMYNFTAGELSLMPGLGYQITDGLLVRMGAFFMSGSEESLYDLVGPSLNAGYALIEFNF